jgi:hypothetical protein
MCITPPYRLLVARSYGLVSGGFPGSRLPGGFVFARDGRGATADLRHREPFDRVVGDLRQSTGSGGRTGDAPLAEGTSGRSGRCARAPGDRLGHPPPLPGFPRLASDLDLLQLRVHQGGFAAWIHCHLAHRRDARRGAMDGERAGPPVASGDVVFAAGSGWFRVGELVRCPLPEGSVRSMGVVVVRVLVDDESEVARSGEQDAVGGLASA